MELLVAVHLVRDGAEEAVPGALDADDREAARAQRRVVSLARGAVARHLGRRGSDARLDAFDGRKAGGLAPHLLVVGQEGERAAHGRLDGGRGRLARRARGRAARRELRRRQRRDLRPEVRAAEALRVARELAARGEAEAGHS